MFELKNQQDLEKMEEFGGLKYSLARDLTSREEGISYRYSFQVPEGTEKIRIRFNVDPRKCEDRDLTRHLLGPTIDQHFEGLDKSRLPSKAEAVEILTEIGYPLNNLVRFFLFDTTGVFVGELRQDEEDGWKGAWVGKDGASAGMIPVSMMPGTWHIELNIGSLLNPTARAEAEIEILRGPEDFRWRAGELHTHSDQSDGRNSPGAVYSGFRDRGYDFISLTDHNTDRGWKGPDAVPEDFSVLSGMEIGAVHGHILGWGVRDNINWRQNDGGVKPSMEIIREIREQGGLACCAHPFIIGHPFDVGSRMEYEDTDFAAYDYLEVFFHPWDIRQIETLKSFALWNSLLNRGERIFGVSAMDVHSWDMIDLDDPVPRVYVHSRDGSPESLLAGLRKGRCFSSCGPMMEFGLDCGSGSWGIGDRVPAAEGEYLRFSCGVSRHREPVIARIVRNGEYVFEKEVTPGETEPVLYEEPAVCGVVPAVWYRLELFRSDHPEVMTAFSNPVFLA